MTGFPPAVKAIMRRRSGGLCEVCGRAVATDFHHRRPRGAGGTSVAWVNLPANGLHICRGCHDRIEGRFPAYSRRAAMAQGFLISLSGRGADTIPVRYRGRLVTLDNEGNSPEAGNEDWKPFHGDGRA
jgi:hypothetical protein